MLSSLINYYELKGDIQGLEIITGSHRLNHFLFAHDCILFCRANLREWEKMSLLLNQYEIASGQTLNMEKISIYFSNNSSSDVK